MSMTISAVAPTADASASTTPASELTAALAATALDDPARPALRAKCIEAWLPLAQHLARRYANRGEVGVSQMHVSRLLAKALVKMRRRIDGEA